MIGASFFKHLAGLVPTRFSNQLALSLLLCLASTLAVAQADTFIAGNGAWSPGSNWSLGFAPGETNDCLLPANSVVIIDLAGICDNFTMSTGGVLTVTPGYLDVYGTSFINQGAITVGTGNGLDFAQPGSLTTMTGGGTITLTNFLSGNFTGFENNVINRDNTINGTGYMGVQQFTNNKLIDANTTAGPLELHGDGLGITNTGTVQASNGGTLLLIPQALAVPFNNMGGIIQALNGSTVQVKLYTITGGTLSTSGTGVIQGVDTLVLNNLTNQSNYQLTTDSETALQGTIINTGTFTVQNGELMASGNAILKGAGVVIGKSPFLLGSYTIPATLLNQSTIEGGGTIGDNNLTVTNEGTINANSNSLNLTAVGPNSLTNSSVMEASGGGTLEIQNTVNNAGGTIEALTDAKVLLNSGTVSGGTLSTTGTGIINSENGTLDGTGSPVALVGSLKVSNSFGLNLKGTINNAGTIALGTSSCAALDGPTTLTGRGKVTMTSSSCFDAFSTTDTLTNQSTIEGSGSIGGSNQMGITNAGNIIATQRQPLTIVPDTVLGFTNSGKLTVNKGSTLNIVGLFNNQPGTTLMGGTYLVTGTFGFENANIVTNAASITLTGTTAQILNSFTNTSALANFAGNTSLGSLSLQSGQVLATATNFNNAGITTVGIGSGFSVGGSYTQTAGTTTVDGALMAPSGLTLEKGSLLGKGTIAAAVTSNASVTAGDSTSKPATLTVTGSYTQNSAGTLNIAIAGTAAGTFGQVAVSNGVSLGGTLAIKRIKGFVPAIGNTFKIVTGSAMSGQFATVKGTSINAGEHFEVSYTPTAVTLTVVSGA
jgi:fibronectin-binding autotransporter adhesin